MKILYLTTWDFTNEETDGVCKKIYSQVAIFEKNGYAVDIIYINNNKIIYKEDGVKKVIGRVGTIKKTLAYIKIYKYIKFKKYSWVYNRYGMMDTFYYRVLKRLYKNGAKILVEIPTYPYRKELPKGLLYGIMDVWDKLYINRLKKVVCRILTYSLDDEIYNIKAIKLINGVDFAKIKVRNFKKKSNVIDLVGVANLTKSQGYDRVIEGIYEYYSNFANNIEINFHIVGNGSELLNYKTLVEKYSLEKHVFFYGTKGGQELDAIYDKCDIAVSSLGLHRVGIVTQASVLKSREYGAKGFPMISSILIDAFLPDDFKFIRYFPENDTPIDMNQIVDFYESLLNERNDIRYEIRNYAFQKCDQSNAFLPAIDYMKIECEEKL